MNKNNTRRYFHILENITQDFYLENLFVSLEYTENSDGTMEGTFVLPGELVVMNKKPNGYVFNETYSSGEEINNLDIIVIKDRFDEPLKPKPVLKEPTEPFFEKGGRSFEWVSVGFDKDLELREARVGQPSWTPKASAVNDLTNNATKLSVKKTYHTPTRETLLENSLFNYFRINDFVRIKSYLFSEKFNETGRWYLIRDFYVSNISIQGSLIEIKIKSHQVLLEKIPCSISTKQKKSMWDFMMSYVFPTILEKTDIKQIIVSKIDYNTMKKSNVGLYRQNINTFATFLSKIMTDYNLQIIWSGIPYKCVFSYGNTFLPPLPFYISGGKEANDGKIYTDIDCYKAFSDTNIQRVYNNDNPVIVRITSVSAQVGSIKNNKAAKIQKIYGDKEALGQTRGIIYNLTTNISLDENALLDRAKKQYTKLKYFGQKNTFIMKEPGSIKTILRFTDDKIFNNGFYYITNVTHTFNNQVGYEFGFSTAVRFAPNTTGLNNLQTLINL